MTAPLRDSDPVTHKRKLTPKIRAKVRRAVKRAVLITKRRNKERTEGERKWWEENLWRRLRLVER